MEVHKMIGLSTSHLSENMKAMLENAEDLDSPVVAFEKGNYGWFLYIPEEDDDSLLEKKETLTEDELNMEKIFAFARKNGADWLMFDCDSEVIPELKTF